MAAATPFFSADAEIFGRKPEKFTKLADIGRIKRLVAAEADMAQARKVDITAKLMFDLADEVPQSHLVPTH